VKKECLSGQTDMAKCFRCGEDAYLEDEGWPYCEELDDRADSEIFCCSSCGRYLELYAYNHQIVPVEYISYING